MTTIDRTFNPDHLPRWSRDIPEVVARAKSNLAYRCRVHEATTRQYQRAIVAEALDDELMTISEINDVLTGYGF